MALSYINNKEIKFGSAKPLNGVYTPGSPTREYEPLDSLGIYLNSGIPLSYGVENGRYMSMSDEFAATSQGNSYSFNQFFAAQMMLGFKLHDRFIACDTGHKIIGTEPLLHKAYLAEITEKTLDYFKIKIYEEKTRTFCIRMSFSEVPTSYVDLTNSFDENGLNLTQTDRQSFLSYYRFYPLTARDPSSRAEETLGVDYYLLPSVECLKELSGDILSKFNAFISSDGSTLTNLGNTAFAYAGDINYVPNYRGETSEAAVSAAESARVILGQVEEIHAGINQILPEMKENLELTKQYRDEAMSTEIGTVREDLNQLNNDLTNVNNKINNTLEVLVNGINIKNGKYVKEESNKFIVISVKAFDKVVAYRSNNQIYYTVLAKYNPTVGSNAEFASGYSGGFTNASLPTIYTPLEIEIPSDGNYVLFTTENSGAVLAPTSVHVNNLDMSKSILSLINDVQNRVDDVEEEFHNEISDINGKDYYDVAVGNTDNLSVVDDSASGFVKSVKKSRNSKRNYISKNIVAINHDDLRKSDYLGVRKIYNKYGFNANFNFILQPFTNVETKEEMIKNVKEMIADGNDIGLHAIMNTSFWWMNKMIDLSPYFTRTFAPSLEELKTVVQGNENVFGYTVTDNTVLSQIGFSNLPSQYANKKVSETTNADLINIYAHYTLIGNESLYTGLDLNDNVQSYTMLRWLEYWYNELIDNTLGYTPNSGLVNKYYSSFKVPEGASQTQADYYNYYPDAQHIISGKIVRFDDVTNPNYNNSEYKKVGYFTKGLFKGHSTCCNYEVRDRIINIAKAFFTHYFGSDNFTSFNRHGSTFIDCFWKSDGVPYDNRDRTILAGEIGKVFNTEKMKFETGQDVLLSNGIKMSMHQTPLVPIYEGQIGLYYGQRGIRYPYFNHCVAESGAISYLALLGETKSFDWVEHQYNEVMKFLPEKDVLKFVYENSGNQISAKDGSHMYIYKYVQQTIDAIRACKDTGKIPTFSWDTVTNDASTMIAIELICKYCYENDIDIVPVERARKIAMSTQAETKSNYFPNPSFNQSLVSYFGGESTISTAYIPDGWFLYDSNGVDTKGTFSVLKEGTSKVLNVSCSSGENIALATRIYGLKAGRYKLTFDAKDLEASSNIRLLKIRNKSKYRPIYDWVERFIPTSNYVSYEVWFDVAEPEIIYDSETAEHQYNKGYEENVCCVEFLIMNNANSASNISIKNPKLQLV